MGSNPEKGYPFRLYYIEEDQIPPNMVVPTGVALPFYPDNFPGSPNLLPLEESFNHLLHPGLVRWSQFPIILSESFSEPKLGDFSLLLGGFEIIVIFRIFVNHL